MSPFVLNKISISARKHGFVCLLLFFLSLFSTAMIMNNIMYSASNSVSMEASDAGSSCISTLVDECSSLTLTSEHNHQNCMDNHCSSFSGLLISYHSHSQNITSVHTALPPKSYVSTYPSTPYSPPIVIS